MKITTRVALEVLGHEAIVRQAYKDSVGVWTWSGGITSAAGIDVKQFIGKPQPMEYCVKVYLDTLEAYAETVRKTFHPQKLPPAQFAAALAFHWNTGAIERATWVKLFKAGDVVGARKSFMKWRKPRSIIKRRQAECDLFFDGTWSNDGTVTEYTRVRQDGTPVWSSAKKVDITGCFAPLDPVQSHNTLPTTPKATGFFGAFLKLLKGFKS